MSVKPDIDFDAEPIRVGDLIKAARKAKGWTQSQLGEAIGTSTQSINRYETGERNIYADKLMAIAAALGIPVGRLFPQGDGLTEEERDLILYRRSHSAHRLVLDSTLRGLQSMDQETYEAD